MMALRPPDIPRRHRPGGLEILHEDRDILIIDKHAGLLTMSYRADESRTAEQILNRFVRKGNPRASQRVFVVHRLDRDTSGLLVFARTPAAMKALKAGWPRTEKAYVALVQGRLAQPAGVLTSHLAEDEDQRVHSVDDPSEGRLARTAYRVIKEVRGISLVRIALLTGRKNQIRAQFSELGHPVVGDVKYGAQPWHRPGLALHARELAFDHPYHGQRVRAVTGIPERIAALVGGCTEEEWAAAATGPAPAPTRSEPSGAGPRRRPDRPARSSRRP